MSREKSVAKSVSLPRSVIAAIQKRLKGKYPRQTFSGYFQERAVEDLQSAGLLPKPEANGQGQTHKEAA